MKRKPKPQRLTEEFRNHIAQVKRAQNGASTSKADRFTALAAKARPLQAQLQQIGMEQVQVCHEMALEIIQQAFPTAEVQRVSVAAQVNPTDFGKSATEAVQNLKAAGIPVNRIVIDTSRMMIFLCR